jgi:hypothetical protein
MDGERVLHVNGHEVVEARFRARVLRLVQLGGGGGDALDGRDVGFLFDGSDVAPAESLVSGTGKGKGEEGDE